MKPAACVSTVILFKLESAATMVLETLTLSSLFFTWGKRIKTETCLVLVANSFCSVSSCFNRFSTSVSASFFCCCCSFLAFWITYRNVTEHFLCDTSECVTVFKSWALTEENQECLASAAPNCSTCERKESETWEQHWSLWIIIQHDTSRHAHILNSRNDDMSQ